MQNSQTKQFIFGKKEVALIFFFMFLLAILFFSFGLKVGKKMALQVVPTSVTSSQVVEVAPTVEKQIPISAEQNTPQAIQKEETDPAISAETYDRLEQELAKLQEDKKEELTQKVTMQTSAFQKNIYTTPHALKGKYTIQLGSFADKEDADRFADGLTARGYDPIVTDTANKDGTGKWFRVSLNAFNTLEEVHQYIKDDSSLLEGDDYSITKFE
ncbi:MAG: SPOR domain-containing protein [Bacteriovoracaceae bacterium]|nr:SPOR domain-containing protein [Bacteriovoracaceae bacterium]